MNFIRFACLKLSDFPSWIIAIWVANLSPSFHQHKFVLFMRNSRWMNMCYLERRKARQADEIHFVVACRSPTSKTFNEIKLCDLHDNKGAFIIRRCSGILNGIRAFFFIVSWRMLLKRDDKKLWDGRMHLTLKHFEWHVGTWTYPNNKTHLTSNQKTFQFSLFLRTFLCETFHLVLHCHSSNFRLFARQLFPSIMTKLRKMSCW